MRSLVPIFVYGFLLDALLSLAGVWLPISLVQGAAAWAVFAFGIVLYVATAFDRRLPKRLILPPMIFLVWTNICGAFPLAFLAPDIYGPALSATQLAIAVAMLLFLRKWRVTPPPIGPAFSWRTFSLVTLPTLVAIPLVLGIGMVNAIGVSIEQGSQGYVKLRPDGLILEERELARGDQRVRLVSMMHIGDRSFYDQILASLPADGTSIVLVEGVTDREGILKNNFSYAKLARLLGLSSQENSSLHESVKDGLPARKNNGTKTRRNIEYRHADIDISTFQPLTLAYIGAIGAILSDPTLATFLRVVNAPDTPFKNPDVQEIVMADILDRRNEHLIDEIGDALENTKTVVVPWGALHLSDIEQSLKAQGFQEIRRVGRPVIRFWRDADADRK